MTSMLIWNIQKFSDNKLNDNTQAPGALVPGQLNMGPARQQFIVDVVNANPNLDLFVIVEVCGDTDPVTPPGTVLRSLSPAAIALRQLQGTLDPILPARWALVPPVMTGLGCKREAVAVFYNPNTLQLVGPWFCSAMPGGPPGTQVYSAVGNQPNPLNAFAGFWGGSMPARPIPAQPFPALNIPNAGLNENQVAPQWQYTVNNAPLQFITADDRSPVLTSFLDLVNGRIINLFSVHTSPGGTAVGAVGRFAQIPVAQAALPNNIYVFAGDFNVDTSANPQPYQGLTALGYSFVLAPAGGQQYCLTHLLPVNTATPWNAVNPPQTPTQNVYPRYGYMGAMDINVRPPVPTDAGSIDNILISPAPVPMVGGVANTVTGAPYNNAPIGMGGLVCPCLLDNPLVHPMDLSPGNAATAAQFQEWLNFQRVLSVSDHMGVFASF